MKNFARLIGLLTGLLMLANAHAQRPAPVPGTFPNSTQQAPDSSRLEQKIDDIPDTVGVFYFLADNPNQETPFADSTLANFQQYDPVRQRSLDYMHLGNLGSAHQPIVFETTWRRGFDVGLHQFDLYMTPATQRRFYRLQKAFTNVSFMVGSEQADSYLTSTFSRNFAKGLNFTIDYDRLSQLGTENQYPNQNTRNTTFSVGFWLKGKAQRYQGFLAISRNTVEHEDNGGIEVEPNLEGQNATTSATDVFLNNAQTRYQHQDLAYTHYFQLGGKPDSIKGITRAYTLSHQLVLGDYRYKFFDNDLDADTAFFNRFPILAPDGRGVRHFIQHQKIENSFRLSTFKLRANRASEAKDERDLLELGVIYSIHFLTQEPSDSTINTLFLTGKWNLSFGERLRLETYGHLGVLGNIGDYRAQGTLLLDLGKFGQLKGEFINQLNAPNLIQHRFYVSQRELWKNDFKQTLETTIGGTYLIPTLQIGITGRYHLLNNYIYYDTLSTPQQSATPLSILQFIVQKDFKVWNFHLDNIIVLQNASEDFIRLPQIYGKHSLYYEGNWFKVLNVKLGFDLRYNDAYFADYYNPVSGQFQLQNQRQVDFYPAIDAFFTMRVTKFRAFVKFENLTNAFLTEDFFYQTAYYAYPPAALRIGFKWRLVD
ncbi:MAG: putative porin [Saprospiraceae bacterium]|nr:putative porin [Saprospiraceae bacterium]